jgi:hypothetical protein
MVREENDQNRQLLELSRQILTLTTEVHAAGTGGPAGEDRDSTAGHDQPRQRG